VWRAVCRNGEHDAEAQKETFAGPRSPSGIQRHDAFATFATRSRPCWCWCRPLSVGCFVPDFTLINLGPQSLKRPYCAREYIASDLPLTMPVALFGSPPPPASARPSNTRSDSSKTITTTSTMVSLAQPQSQPHPKVDERHEQTRPLSIPALTLDALPGTTDQLAAQLASVLLSHLLFLKGQIPLCVAFV
jgi:hypothetical protein